MSEQNLILVVDDEPINYTVLEGILSRNGFRVLTADSGPEGRELAGSEQPDLILLDVMMPDESGFDTCVRLKKDPATAEIPVIFLTCLDDVSSKVNGLSLGAVDYITKPFNSAEVLARIQAQLNTRNRQKAIIDAQADRLGQVKSAQQGMLVRPEQLPGARFGVSYTPVLEAGGDFYDVVDFGRGRFGYMVADVSGHDLGAGFVTSSLKALFRQNAGPDHTPARTLEAINAVLRTITPPEMFLTAAYLLLDRPNGRASLASAGHPPLVRLSGGQAGLLEAPGDVVGMFEQVELGELELPMAPDDRFFLFTDGLLERRSGLAGSIRGNLDLVQEAALATADQDINLAVQDMARTVLGAHTPEDDVVLLGVRV